MGVASPLMGGFGPLQNGSMQMMQREIAAQLSGNFGLEAQQAAAHNLADLQQMSLGGLGSHLQQQQAQQAQAQHQQSAAAAAAAQSAIWS